MIHDLSVVRPWVLRSALGAGLFDALSTGPRPIADLETTLHADTVVLNEVLRYVAAIGYIDVADDIVSATDLGLTLSQLPRDLYGTGSPMLMFDRVADELHTAWSEGAPVASRREVPYWTEVARDPDACATIGRYQPRSVQFDGAQLVDAITRELSAGSAVLDLGGSNGALARDVSLVHDGRIGVLDLPEMIPNARRNLADCETDRFALHGGSFFDAVPAGYDLYVLNSILYDYSDAQVRDLFAGLHHSMSPGTGLVVSEVLLSFPDEYTRAESSLMLTLNTGGTARSADDVAAAIASVGFGDSRRRYESEQRYTLVFDR